MNVFADVPQSNLWLARAVRVTPRIDAGLPRITDVNFNGPLLY